VGEFGQGREIQCVWRRAQVEQDCFPNSGREKEEKWGRVEHGINQNLKPGESKSDQM